MNKINLGMFITCVVLFALVIGSLVFFLLNNAPLGSIITISLSAASLFFCGLSSFLGLKDGN